MDSETSFYLLVLLGALPGYVFITWLFFKDEGDPWWKSSLLLALPVVTIVPIGWFGNLAGVMLGLGYLWEWSTGTNASGGPAPRALGQAETDRGAPVTRGAPMHQAPATMNAGPVQLRLHGGYLDPQRFGSVAEAVSWAENYLQRDRNAGFTIRDEEGRRYSLSRREGLRAGPTGLQSVSWEVGDPYPDEAIEAETRQIAEAWKNR